MKWEPNDVLHLIALIGALALLSLGAFMMWQGIAAEGAIDLKSSVLSGSIKTGSAGLFIAFLAFCIVAFVLLAAGKPVGQTAQAASSKVKNIGRLLATDFAATIVAGTLAALGNGSGFGLIAAFCGFLLIPLGAAYLSFLETE